MAVSQLPVEVPVKHLTDKQAAIIRGAMQFIETTDGYYFSMADWSCCLAHAIMTVCLGRMEHHGAETHYIARDFLGISEEAAERLFFTNFRPGCDWGPLRQLYDEAKNKAERLQVLRLRVAFFDETGL